MAEDTLDNSRPFLVVTHKTGLVRLFETFGGQQEIGVTVDQVESKEKYQACHSCFISVQEGANNLIRSLLKPRSTEKLS